MKKPTLVLMMALVGSILTISIAYAEIVERIVAVINNDIITLSELDEMINSVQGDELHQIKDQETRQKKLLEYRKTFLEQMIDQRLLTQQYSKLQITASEQDVDEMINVICNQNNISQDTLYSELSRQGISLAEYRDQMRQHILQTKFIEQQIRPRISITEDDVKRLYTQKLGELSQTKVADLDGVLVTIARGAGPSAVEASKKLSRQVKELLEDGKSPDEIARQFAGSSVRSLANMGTFKPGELLDALDSAVFKLKEGEVTDPVELPQGMYVVKVKSYKTHSEAKSYEDVREQLYRRLYDQQLETQLQIFAKNARRDSHVEILL